MSRRLVRTVFVEDANGEAVAFGPHSPIIPPWAERQITNPSVWATEAVSAAASDESPPAPPPPVSTPAAGEHPKPPAAGAGSGVTEWRAYAESLGIDVVDNATRADIQELVDAYEQTQAAAGGQP